MVRIDVQGERVDVEIQGLHRFWALRRRLSFGRDQIANVRHDPDAARWWQRAGWRLPGTELPGVIRAGSYRRRGTRTFWDITHPENAVVIDLCNADYDRLIVEVDDPQAVVEQLQSFGHAGALPNL